MDVVAKKKGTDVDLFPVEFNNDSFCTSNFSLLLVL